MAFFTLSYIYQHGQLVYIMNFVTNYIVIFLNSIHALVILSFNSQARAELRGLFRGSRSLPVNKAATTKGSRMVPIQ